MQEQTGKPTLQTSKAMEAHQHHRKRLILAVLTVPRGLSAELVVMNKVADAHPSHSVQITQCLGGMILLAHGGAHVLKLGIICDAANAVL